MLRGVAYLGLSGWTLNATTCILIRYMEDSTHRGEGDVKTETEMRL